MSQPISRRVRFEIFKRDNFTCQYCGAKADQHALEVDHINPRTLGLDHDMANLTTACIPCNSGKGEVPLDRPAPESDRLDWDLPSVADLGLSEFSP